MFKVLKSALTAQKNMFRKKEMSLNQAKVAAKVGDIDATKASLAMAEKPGKFEPLPIYNSREQSAQWWSKRREKIEKEAKTV